MGSIIYRQYHILDGMGTREHLSAIESVTRLDETLQGLLFFVYSALQTELATVCLKTPPIDSAGPSYQLQSRDAGRCDASGVIILHI